MLSTQVNIAISGLGLSATTELKSDIRRIVPDQITINWTNISDPEVECLLINEVFFEQQNIQRIILSRNIPYLKITKNLQDQNLDDHILSIPITHESSFKSWINKTLLKIESSMNSTEPPPSMPDQMHTMSSTYVASAQQSVSESVAHQTTPAKDVEFFLDIFEAESGKLFLSDQSGTLAIIDHRGHYAWMPTTRTEIKSDATLRYQPATSSDFHHVTLRRQYNLEDWIFHLIWNTPNLIELPDADDHYQIQYSVQPIGKDKKILLKLSASFVLGGQISEISERLNIPVQLVQTFIAAHAALNNVSKISSKESKFGKNIDHQNSPEDTSNIKSFFSKLKLRFGF